MPWEIKMAREFLVHEGSVHSEAGSLLGSSEAFLLLCMIVVSLSIISMVIFACGDSNSGGGKRHGWGGGACGGGGGGACGGGGGGGGGGGCGGGGGGGGGGGDSLLPDTAITKLIGTQKNVIVFMVNTSLMVHQHECLVLTTHFRLSQPKCLKCSSKCGTFSLPSSNLNTFRASRFPWTHHFE
ncbi:hypothetical protein OIU79_020686 [Salix purpurea]|uniref:Glycine-rich protein n=1 Tax=Salix purpurea TaxID=77065 RepID=A0A9Q0WMC2_SALPP|nr:hypothetical protein OIU79_020686 [Salix purpurea]